MVKLVFRLFIVCALFATNVWAGEIDRRRPVVLSGAAVPALLDAPLENLGLFTYDGEKFSPAVFQIDQRREGRYLLKSGPGAEAGSGRLGGEDEIAFLAQAGGARFIEGAAPAKTIAGYELLLDHLDDVYNVYVYIFRFSEKAPRSSLDLVRYDHRADRIYARDYVIGYSETAPISIDYLTVTEALGGGGQSVADRQKVRFRAESLASLVTLERDEEDFDSEVVAWTDGTVRVLRRTANRVRLIWRIESPRVELVSTYWATQMLFPIRMTVPFRLSHFFRDIRMQMYIDTPPDVPGRYFYNGNNPAGVPIDGRMSAAERVMDKAASDWQVVAGTTPAHREGWYSRQIYDPEKMKVDFRLHYQDDSSTPDAPERYPGCFGCLGFDLAGLEELEAGEYDLTVQMIPLAAYAPGDEKALADLAGEPLAPRATLLPTARQAK